MSDLIINDLPQEFRDISMFPPEFQEFYIQMGFENIIQCHHYLHRELREKELIRDLKMYFSNVVLQELDSKILYKQYFKYVVCRDIIAKAMSPERVMKQLSQYDDFESFFENI